jgi:hypothetical protein
MNLIRRLFSGNRPQQAAAEPPPVEAQPPAVRTPYVYDGALSPRVIESILDAMRKYPFPVEMKRPPSYEWTEANLPMYDSTGEDCMGNVYPKRTRMYCIVVKNFPGYEDGCFFFLPNGADKQRVLDGCPDLVINPNPFVTVIV